MSAEAVAWLESQFDLEVTERFHATVYPRRLFELMDLGDPAQPGRHSTLATPAMASRSRPFGPGRVIRVLGIDPGGTTGLAVLNYTEHWGAVPFFWQEAGATVTTKIRRLLLNGTYDLVAIESFVVNRRAGRSRTAGAGEATRLIIGGVAQLCREAGIRLVPRPAGVVKPWATDRRLDAAGLIRPTRGLPHARDAARHALYAAVRDLGLPDPLSIKERT